MLATKTASTLPEVSVFDGLASQQYCEQLVTLMDSRLAPSSKSTIRTAVSKHWLPFTQRYGYEEFIQSGDAHRGGRMASFVLYLIEQGALAFTDNYLLNGTIPYFHLFVSQGEIAQKPMQINFDGIAYDDDQKKLKLDKPWPKVYPFYVDTWQSGIIHFRC